MEVTKNHRPLMAGIAIKRHGAPAGLTDDKRVYYGTLTAVARRNAPNENERVLVTNLHVVSKKGSDKFYALDGNESIYQFEATESNKVGTVYVANGKNSWLSADPNDTTTKVADLVALKVKGTGTKSAIPTSLGVHEHGKTNTIHNLRPIVQPVKAPENGLPLIYVGATSGAGKANVEGELDKEDFEVAVASEEGSMTVNLKYDGVARIYRRDFDGGDGDSGAPLLWEDPDGNYHLCCIHFARGQKANDVNYSFAFPASVAEEEFGITFGVKAPKAVASAPEYRAKGVPFVLNGAASAAEEAGATITNYQWVWESFSPSPGEKGKPSPKGELPFDFAEQTKPNLSILSRKYLGEYQYKLMVTDSNGARASDTVTVTVATNTPPVVQTSYRPFGKVRPGTRVRLNSDGSKDPDGGALTYKWKQVFPPDIDQMVPVKIEDSDKQVASFTAPDKSASLYFELKVTDVKGESATGTVNVNVVNRPPIANAGPNQVRKAGSMVTLEGSVSDDDADDRASVTHKWTKGTKNPCDVDLCVVEGYPAQRTFVPEMSGTYKFTLTATDPYGLTASDGVEVRVLSGSEKLAPDKASATVKGNGMTIAWDSVSAVIGYDVQLGEAEDGGQIGYASFTTKSTAYSVNNLKYNTRYYYRVRALFSKYAGPWVEGKSVVTPADPLTSKPTPPTPPPPNPPPSTSPTPPAPSTPSTPASDWIDVSPLKTQNWVSTEWKDSGLTRQNPVVLIHEKQQTRTISYDKRQKRTEGGVTTYRWKFTTVPDSKWVIIPEVCDSWVDTGETRVKSYGVYARTGETCGSGASRKCKETRTNQREKRQKGTSKPPYSNLLYRWVDTTSAIQINWAPCPEPVSNPDPWTAWMDMGSPQVKSYGPWSDTGLTQQNPVSLVIEKQQERTVYWEKQQTRTSQTGNRSQTRWVDVESTKAHRWVYVSG